MDMVLKVVINDGKEVIIDGFDEISFYHEYPIRCETDSGYGWQQRRYNKLVNNLIEYNFIEIKRSNTSDELRYRNIQFAYKNNKFEANDPLLLRTSSINMIFKMY